ncbi:uncharacterized protein LOC144326982 isoform X1 [Podarcis muralis]
MRVGRGAASAGGDPGREEPPAAPATASHKEREETGGFSDDVHLPCRNFCLAREGFKNYPPGNSHGAELKGAIQLPSEAGSESSVQIHRGDPACQEGFPHSPEVLAQPDGRR